MKPMNESHRPEPNEQLKTTADSRRTEWLVKLALCMNAEFSPEAMKIYLEILTKYPDETLIPAIQKAMREWDKPSLMPTPTPIATTAMK